MKTGPASRFSGTIHRQQLFHWIGDDLDRRNKRRKVLSDALVNEYLDRLRGSLERGLWVKRPRQPEAFVYRKQSFLLDQPITCFTEWSLGDSLPHSAKYGRLGFGFPKRWVIHHGGQSVTYFRHSEKGHFLQAIFKLLARFPAPTNAAAAASPSLPPGFAELRYLLHFAKMIRLQRAKASRPKARPAAPPAQPIAPPTARRRATSPATRDARTYQRKFGHPLEFAEEREWRVVYQSSNPAFVPGGGTPDYFLPYVPGEELFTLVLPDSKVVSRVLQDSWLTDRLFTPWNHYRQLHNRHVPPVTLLAHSDLGTF